MHPLNNKVLCSLIALMLMSALIACNQQKGGVQEKVVKRSIPSRPSGNNGPDNSQGQPTGGEQIAAGNPLASVKAPYNPDGKIDPFRPLFQKEEQEQPTKTIEKAKKKPERPRTPLERLDLGQLKLVAVVYSNALKKALVEEDSGKGYVLELGTSVGRERGKVIEIQKDRVIIEQEFEDDFGDQVVKQKELKLQKPPGDY
ncbi:MAG: pilus assembly protein PilP [Desulfobacterales bacterium]|jgi:Tfp pilus assembly protein PilP